MATENPDTPVTEGSVPSIELRVPDAMPVVMTGEGVGQMFSATRDFIEDNLKADVVNITDPATGAQVPATLNREGGVVKLPADFFDDVIGAPSVRRGTAKMTTLDSFIDHVNRFGDEDSAVFVRDNENPGLTAVLDYHRRDRLRLEGEADQVGERIHGDYRFGGHRTAFDFPLSEEWKAWNEANSEVMTMVEFSTFLERRAGDIDAFDDGAVPETLERFVTVNGGKNLIASFGQLLELSRGLKVNENSNVEEAINLASGEGQIRFDAAHTTSVKVPTMFFIAIPIFKRGVFYRIGAALRYRKTPGGLRFWYELNRPDLSFDHAVREAVERVNVETEAQVFYGSPE